MLFDNFYSWGHPAREIAKMTLAPQTDSQRFNANYIKTQRRVHVPVPHAGPPTLPSKGSDQWGQLVAKAVVPVLKDQGFNKNYMKPNPENLRHVPPPRPYTKEGALAQLAGAQATEPLEAKEEITPIDKATRIRDAQVDGSPLEQYWNDIIVSLTQLKDIQAMRPLTSQELEVERAILQRIKGYELDPANALQVPGAIPAAAAGSVGLAQKITDAIAALPQPATAQQIQQAIQAAQAAVPAPPPPGVPPGPPPGPPPAGGAGGVGGGPPPAGGAGGAPPLVVGLTPGQPPARGPTTIFDPKNFNKLPKMNKQAKEQLALDLGITKLRSMADALGIRTKDRDSEWIADTVFQRSPLMYRLAKKGALTNSSNTDVKDFARLAALTPPEYVTALGPMLGEKP